MTEENKGYMWLSTHKNDVFEVSGGAARCTVNRKSLLERALDELTDINCGQCNASNNKDKGHLEVTSYTKDFKTGVETYRLTCNTCGFRFIAERENVSNEN